MLVQVKLKSERELGSNLDIKTKLLTCLTALLWAIRVKKVKYLESLNVVNLTDLLHGTLGRSILLWWQAAWHDSSVLFKRQRQALHKQICRSFARRRQ